MKKSDYDIPRVDLYRKTILFNKNTIKIYKNRSKTIKIKMTNIFDHEILRRIQINQPKSCRKHAKHRLPPRYTPRGSPGAAAPGKTRCERWVKNSTLGRAVQELQS